MRKLIIILLLFPFAATAQIDQAVDNKINNSIGQAKVDLQNIVKRGLDSSMQQVIWYTELQKTVSKSGTIQLDTLTAASGTTEVYQLVLTGSGTAVRIVFVTNTGGVYSIRVTNPATYTGATGTAFNTTVDRAGVVVSLTGNNTVRAYKYGRKNL